MKPSLILSFCLTLLVAVSQAQSFVSFSGTTTDSKENIIHGATVYLLNTDRGAVSDAKGKFVITGLPPGTYTVQISAIGFATQTYVMDLRKTSDNVRLRLPDITTELDAVYVSAQKREEALQKIPSSISVLSSRQVYQYRLWNTKDLTAIVPNLYSSNSGDDRNVTSIRGIATTSYDPAVATYVDGVNQFSLDTYIPQLLDIERIEVLRGPQGTLYGRNAMGGVINIITKQPSNTASGFAELSLGNYAQQRYIAGARLPLIRNKLFLGISTLYEQRKGFYKNEFYNNSFDRQNRTAGNYYLKFLANRQWTVTLNAKYQFARNNGAFPMVNGKDEAFANPFVLNQDAVAKMIDNTFNSSLVINHAGTNLNFSSQTSYQSNHRIYNHPLDGDFAPIDGVSIINDYGGDWNTVKVLTQEFKFSSAAGSTDKLKWTAGSYLFHQMNPNKQAVYFGDDATLVGAPDVNFYTVSSTRAKSMGVAFFGQINYMLTNKLSLIAGLRYDTERKKYNVLGEYQKDPDPIFETRPDTSATANFSAVSPKIGLAYEWSSDHNLFVSYSRGYRTGGLTGLSSDPSQPPLYPYKPEYSNNIEAGLKNNFANNKVRLNLTLFYTTVTDAQVPTLVLPDAITVTRNAGKLTSKGAEIEFSSTPVRDLQLDYNFGYTDATYKNLKLSQGGASADLDGKKQIFTPEFTSMLAVQYGYAIVPKVKVSARAEWAFIGKQYFDLSNTIEQKGYSLVNIKAGFSFPFADLMFWMRNAGDEKYIAYAYDFGAIHLGDPRTYGVTLAFQISQK